MTGRGVLLGAIGGAVLLQSQAWAEAAVPERPNVLAILVDDLGYGDLSSFGAKDLRTPAIDRLMAAGMRFNEFYANCCVCSPTRAALLSGRYPEFVGIPGVIRERANDSWGCLTPDSIMLPELFRKHGYHTTLIGKWHLGLLPRNLPNARGFDEFRGFLGDMMDDYWNHRRHGINFMRENEKVIDPKGHATDLFTQWTLDSLKAYAAKPERPFFLYLAYNAPHCPIQPPKEWLDRVLAREEGISKNRAKMVAFIEHLDDGIGKVLASLDTLGLRENTIVVFTSDNGGKLSYGASNGPLRGDKTHLYEGGIKVPACVSWPGHVRAGQVTDFRALTMDILPTMADLCGIPVAHEIDGRSFKPLLMEGRQAPFERPAFHMWLQHGSKECVREGDWKLVRDKPGAPLELYNLKDDPYEKRDLARSEPERLQQMTGVLEAHIARARRVPWKRADDVSGK